MKKYLSLEGVDIKGTPVPAHEMTEMAEFMRKIASEARRHEIMAVESAKKVHIK